MIFRFRVDQFNRNIVAFSVSLEEGFLFVGDWGHFSKVLEEESLGLLGVANSAFVILRLLGKTVIVLFN